MKVFFIFFVVVALTEALRVKDTPCPTEFDRPFLKEFKDEVNFFILLKTILNFKKYF
jgi:hypothetical protein